MYTMVNLYRRWSIRLKLKLKITLYKKVCISFLALSMSIWKYPLKIYKLENILSSGLASPNQIFPPYHKLEIFGAVSEDDQGQISLIVNFFENWRWYRFLKKILMQFSNCESWTEGENLRSIHQFITWNPDFRVWYPDFRVWNHDFRVW